MFLSQFLSADTASAPSAPASKTSSVAESQAKDGTSSASSKGFTDTLKDAFETGSTGASGNIESTSEGKKKLGGENKDDSSKLTDSKATDGQAVNKVAQGTDNIELLQEGSSDDVAQSTSSENKTRGQAAEVDDAESGDDASVNVAAQQVGSALASSDNAKSSMSEGEELLQRLSASRSQLAGHSASGPGKGADGKLLPPDAMAAGSDNKAQLSAPLAKEGVATKEGAAGKEALGKELQGKDGSSKDALAKELLAKELLVKDPAAKADSQGKVALAGMTLSGADLAELKNGQGTSPLSQALAADGALTSSAKSDVAALMGLSASASSPKGTLMTKGSAGALAAASMAGITDGAIDGAMRSGTDDGLGTSVGETQGLHAAHRTAAAGMVVAEGEKPGNAQPPLLLAKEQAGDQLADRVQMMMSKNLKHVDIRLDPPELGKLQIKLSMNNDQASVQITVANQQSRDLVEQAMPRLRELLHQQGLQLAQSSVQQDSSRQFAGGSQQQMNGQAGSQSQHGEPGSGQGTPHELANGTAAQSHSADLWMTAPKDGVDYYA
ncbi:flagellar hook-length control protein FliK [Photobacterium rosenbergii]|uniref:Flagellar hook-length control protein FliK n=1 Tax=Photobacterium rosenbergii TaxID=294936 RepID=A0ABU3ZMJ3_9GAMM|nr:flagellar hook-length control protein FliK [Photobacterium rosenbergii]MDV5171118.1 flagellar hook-length control protein FliK [Photobacterium rosenbergii]